MWPMVGFEARYYRQRFDPDVVHTSMVGSTLDTIARFAQR
jgi:hypothetical protein